jgi:hypothetical protein
MTTKRKPTLKQLFTAWKKHQKKCSEARQEKWKLEDMAREIGGGTELVNDGEYVYRITVSVNYGAPYTIERLVKTDELNKLK